MRAFPPRVSKQPYFYPVLNLDYAIRIASDWNVRTDPFAGYVTEFDIDDGYSANFQQHIVGNSAHKELWVPSQEMEEFNSHILGPIRVTSAYFGQQFRGYIPDRFNFSSRDALGQFVVLAHLLDYSRMDFIGEIHTNNLAVFLHFPYWSICNLDRTEVPDERRSSILTSIQGAWSKELPELPKVTLGGP